MNRQHEIRSYYPAQKDHDIELKTALGGKHVILSQLQIATETISTHIKTNISTIYSDGMYKQQPMRYKKHARTDGKLKAKLAIDALKRRTCFRICWWIGSGWKKKGVLHDCGSFRERYVALQHIGGQLGTTITHYRSLWFYHGSSQLGTRHFLCFCSGSNADTYP